jgi:hypothetical protein
LTSIYRQKSATRLNAVEAANSTISTRDRFALRRTTFENSTWYKTLPLAARVVTRFLGLVMLVLLSAHPLEGQEARVQRLFPTTTGQVFVIDDCNHIVTQTDMGFNYFMGNTG